MILMIEIMARFFGILIIILSVFVAEVFSKAWNGITPGISTRHDVEKILGRARLPDNLNIYKYKKSRVHIHYKKKDNDFSDKDIVQRIEVYPDKIQTLASYIKKLPNFRKDFIKTEIEKKNSHIEGRAVYFNAAEGFEIWVQRSYETSKEIVTGFGYWASGRSLSPSASREN